MRNKSLKIVSVCVLVLLILSACSAKAPAGSGNAGDESVVFELEYDNALKLLQLSNSYLLQLPDKAKAAENE